MSDQTELNLRPLKVPPLTNFSPDYLTSFRFTYNRIVLEPMRK